MSLSAIETAVANDLKASNSEMRDLLEKLVNTDSPSREKLAVDAAGGIISNFCDKNNIHVSIISHDEFGDVLKAEPFGGGSAEKNSVILMGHRDTVFPLGEAARRPYREDNKRAYGPGVGDMKAGLVINVFILRALKRHSNVPLPIKGLFTSDEEIGSPGSRPVIEREAAQANTVFNSEPARASGKVVVGRKGGIFLRLDVYGKAAHSGAKPGTGISAIDAIARKVIAIHGLCDPLKGINLNVGMLHGGEVINMVAPHAYGEFDLRYITPEDRAGMLEQVNAVAAREDVPGARAEISILSEFVPLKQSEASKSLYELYRGAARDVGFEVEGDFSGGCADSGFTSEVGAPTLCGTGAIGGNFHSKDEYIELASLVPRAQALAFAALRRLNV